MSTASSVVEPGTMVPLALIQTETGTQARVKVHGSVVRQYAEAMTEQLSEGGLRFPPIVVFTDGQHYWVGDGCHRVLAARQLGLTEIAAEVHSGSERDALLHSISANSTHGLARSNADKRKAVTLLLGDAEWSQWSDREIARRCQVSQPTVSRMRGASDKEFKEFQMRNRKVRRGGAVYEMNTNAGAAAGQEEAAATSPPAAPAAPVTPTDPLGIPLPKERERVFAALVDFQEAKDLFARLGQVVDRIGQGPGGELYQQELIRTADNGRPGLGCAMLRAAQAKLRAAEPYCCYCPNCHAAHPGRTDPRCRSCAGRGWTTRAAYESCPATHREEVTRLK